MSVTLTFTADNVDEVLAQLKGFNGLDAALGKTHETETASTSKKEKTKVTKAVEEEKEKVTIEDVRKEAQKLVAAERQPELKAVLKKNGVGKISELTEEQFADVRDALKSLNEDTPF